MAKSTTESPSGRHRDLWRVEANRWVYSEFATPYERLLASKARAGTRDRAGRGARGRRGPRPGRGDRPGAPVPRPAARGGGGPDQPRSPHPPAGEGAEGRGPLRGAARGLAQARRLGLKGDVAAQPPQRTRKPPDVHPAGRRCCWARNSHWASRPSFRRHQAGPPRPSAAPPVRRCCRHRPTAGRRSHCASMCGRTQAGIDRVPMALILDVRQGADDRAVVGPGGAAPAPAHPLLRADLQSKDNPGSPASISHERPMCATSAVSLYDPLSAESLYSHLTADAGATSALPFRDESRAIVGYRRENSLDRSSPAHPEAATRAIFCFGAWARLAWRPGQGAGGG